jgi:threonine aldolase
MAQKLHQALQEFPELEITSKCQSNAVFVKIPKAWVKPLREHYFFYVWDEKTFECRLMTSWDTTESDVQGFISEIRKLSRLPNHCQTKEPQNEIPSRAISRLPRT